MGTTVQQLAALVQGVVVGDGAAVIEAARALREAGPGDITFLDQPKRLADCQATAIVVPGSIAASERVLIQVPDPLDAFVAIVRHLHGRPAQPVTGVDARAAVHSTAQLGADVTVYPYAIIAEGAVLGARCTIYPNTFIGRFCQLGDDVTIYPNAVIYDETVIGARVIIHANAVIGADGFGYRQQQGRHVKIPQLGWVEIGADVEIGAGATIDRGTFGPTHIGAGTKIDNLVQIAHNCRIGEHNLLCAQVGIAGSSVTGDHVIAAGQAGIADHLTIGDRTIIGAQAGIASDLPAGQIVMGTPSRPAMEWKRIMLTLDKLPTMRRQLDRVKRHLGLSDDQPREQAA